MDIFVDIHCHILPGVDDGPKAMDQALMLVDQARQEGTKMMMATPHCFNGVFHSSPQEILSGCRQLQETLMDHGIPMGILPGAENRVTPDLVTKYDQGEVMTLNHANQYILLEMPEMILVDGMVALLLQFMDREVTPIIAHPERNRFILSKPSVLEKLTADGVLLQLTAASLMGSFGKKVEKLSETIVRMAPARVLLASDIHPGRQYRIKAAAQKLTRLVGQTTAHQMLYGHSEKWLTNSTGGRYSI